MLPDCNRLQDAVHQDSSSLSTTQHISSALATKRIHASHLQSISNGLPIWNTSASDLSSRSMVYGFERFGLGIDPLPIVLIEGFGLVNVLLK